MSCAPWVHSEAEPLYAKVFTQILDSSIAEDYQIRHTFEDLLKLCDQNGVVDMTLPSIARRLNVPLELVARCISELEKPDPASRTQDHGGCRIVRIDDHREWGWVIVNYAYYRSLASEEQRRERTRVRVDNFRMKRTVTLGNACNAKQKQKQKDMHKQIKQTHASLDEVKLHCAKIGLPESDGEWFFHKCEGSGWQNDGKPIKNWKGTITAWKLAGFVPSIKTKKGSAPKLPEQHQLPELITVPNL